MSANRHVRRALTFAATASSGGAHFAPRPGCRASGAPDTQRGPGAPDGAPAAVTAAKTSGWRVAETVGPDRRPVYGLLTAVSANDAWSAWSGSVFYFVQHWTGRAWHSVTIPSQVAGALLSPISIGAGPGGEVWLFSTLDPAEAIRHTSGKWVLQPVPRWVLQPGPGTISATTTAVFGPCNVWVFSLGAGAVHYDGRTWAKVKMPEVPDGVSAAAPGDIWALGPGISFVMHWNGTKWLKAALPILPLRYGATVSYSNITAVGPHDAWLMRTISSKSRLPSAAMMHWNGKTWLTVASPADVVGSLVPDGHGGLWADGTDINPGGFWYIYHLAGRHWTKFTPPGMFIHSPQELTWIPGTRSVWATGSNYSASEDHNPKAYFGVLLKYGP
jgi:hypothetical protein